MHEMYKLEVPVFPIFLEKYIPLVESFIARKHMTATPQRKLDFARHLILAFYAGTHIFANALPSGRV